MHEKLKKEKWLFEVVNRNDYASIRVGHLAPVTGASKSEMKHIRDMLNDKHAPKDDDNNVIQPAPYIVTRGRDHQHGRSQR